MEFALAAFSAVLVPVVSELTSVISNLKGESYTSAESIMGHLNLINAFIRDHRFRDSYTSHTWRASVQELQRLAEDIEDCIDRFNAEVTNAEQFAKEIVELKKRTLETQEQINVYFDMDKKGSQGGAATSSVQGQQVPPTAFVPKELQTGPVDLNSLLYFSSFPPGLEASSNTLIRMWMSEGFVQTEKDAVDHLEALIKLRIILSTQESNNGKVKRCKPPEEALRNICNLSTHENFMLFCDDNTQMRSEYAPRRLSVHPNRKAISELNLPKDLSRLRTLVIFPTDKSLPGDKAILDFSRYGVLRVLDVKDCALLHLGEKHLLAICGLRLMKYLSFGGNINRVPRKIEDLKLLETLNLRGSETITLYSEVILLPRLKHLHGKFQLSRSYSGLALVWGLGLEFGFGQKMAERKMAKLQAKVGKECRLETLAGFVVDNRKGFAQLMSQIKMLRKVEIRCENNASKKNMDDLAKAITEFITEGLNMPKPGRSLEVDVSTFLKEDAQKFLDSIQLNGGCLFSFKLHAKLTKFPQFVTQLSGIEELCLSSTTLNGKDMIDGLSKLTMLKYLKLVERNLGPLTIEPQQLPALVRLCLVGMDSLCGITIRDHALPFLISLHILCKSLADLPGINISSITSLKEVALLSGVGKATENAWRTSVNGHRHARFYLIDSP